MSTSRETNYGKAGDFDVTWVGNHGEVTHNYLADESSDIYGRTSNVPNALLVFTQTKDSNDDLPPNVYPNPLGPLRYHIAPDGRARMSHIAPSIPSPAQPSSPPIIIGHVRVDALSKLSIIYRCHVNDCLTRSFYRAQDLRKHYFNVHAVQTPKVQHPAKDYDSDTSHITVGHILVDALQSTKYLYRCHVDACITCDYSGLQGICRHHDTVHAKSKYEFWCPAKNCDRKYPFSRRDAMCAHVRKVHGPIAHANLQVDAAEEMTHAPSPLSTERLKPEMHKNLSPQMETRLGLDRVLPLGPKPEQCELLPGGSLYPINKLPLRKHDPPTDTLSHETLSEKTRARKEITEGQPGPPTSSPSSIQPEEDQRNWDERIQAPGTDEDIDWTDETRNAAAKPSTTSPTPSVALSTCTLPTTTTQDLTTSLEALVLELLEAVTDQHEEFNINETSFANQTPLRGCATSSASSSGASGTSTSSKSASTLGSGSSAGATDRSILRVRRPSEREDDDESSRKKPSRGERPTSSDILRATKSQDQMPCPLQESDGCHGTNRDISVLLRDLQGNHRIVICTLCCTKVEVPDGEKPSTALATHQVTSCIRQCIDRRCDEATNTTTRHHRRTGNCPSWSSLSNETRWNFIWTLVNPGRMAPPLQLSESPGWLHRPVPAKRQTPSRPVPDIAKDIQQKIETNARQRRLEDMERQLSAAHDHAAQVQNAHVKQVENLENIIETLLERLTDNNISIAKSLEKRIRRECPSVLSQGPAAPPPMYAPHQPSPNSAPTTTFQTTQPAPYLGVHSGWPSSWTDSQRSSLDRGRHQSASSSETVNSDFQSSSLPLASSVPHQKSQDTSDKNMVEPSVIDDTVDEARAEPHNNWEPNILTGDEDWVNTRYSKDMEFSDLISG